MSNLAERRGFEPRNQLPSYYLSKVAQSTTLPSLQSMHFTGYNKNIAKRKEQILDIIY